MGNQDTLNLYSILKSLPVNYYLLSYKNKTSEKNNMLRVAPFSRYKSSKSKCMRSHKPISKLL